MKIITRLARTKLPLAQDVTVPLLVEAHAPRKHDATRSPVALVAVVDVSGSMKGRKLSAVREALAALCHHLTVGDMFGLVAFSSGADVIVPLIEITAETRRRIREAIDTLVVAGGTNLAAGLLAGFDMVRGRPGLPENTRTIVLTDGEANEGIAVTRAELTELVRAELAGGLSAFGYGDSCDHVMLHDLAVAGRGTFAYITGHDEVMSAFARELGGLISTYATDVAINVASPFGASASNVGTVLYQGVARHVAMLKLPAQHRLGDCELARVEVSFVGRDRSVERRAVSAHAEIVPAGAADLEDVPEVARAVDELRLRAAIERAERLAEDGKHDAACAELEATRAALRDERLRKFLLESVIPSYRRDNYHRSMPFRWVTRVAICKPHGLLAPRATAEALGIEATPDEAEMERSFRARAHQAKEDQR